MSVWLCLGAPAVYLGIGGLFALIVHKAFTGGLPWQDWLRVMLLWPTAFRDDLKF